jgi:NAD-dependent DNA ligase
MYTASEFNMEKLILSINSDTTVVHALRLEKLRTLVEVLTKQYEKGNPLMDDEVFDIVLERLHFLEAAETEKEERKTDSKGFSEFFKEKKEVVDPPNPVGKHLLPFFMGSQNKLAPAKIERWVAANPARDYVITHKLDGISCLLHVDAGIPRLYTRGNGKIGRDITPLIQFVNGFPSDLKESVKKGIPYSVGNVTSVRGELIMRQDTFKASYPNSKNARNVVAGIVNSKSPLPTSKLIDFVAFEVLQPMMRPWDQLDSLERDLFIPVAHCKGVEMPDASELSETLYVSREISPYDIDGLVITADEVHEHPEDSNPSYSFAFKDIRMNDKAEVVVTKVEWNVSKDGYLKPVIHFDPCLIGKVTVKKVTAFNARYVQENGIGPGARIIVTRSGDVIPHILEVGKTAKIPASPEDCGLKFTWSESGVDAVVTDVKNTMYIVNNLIHFMKALEVDGIGKETITRIVEGGTTTVGEIFRMSKEDLMKLDGVKDKKATVFFNAFSRAVFSPVAVMHGSNIFDRGIGRKKLELILKNHPEIITERYFPTDDELKKLPGINKMADKFNVSLEKFWVFVEANNITLVT